MGHGKVLSKKKLVRSSEQGIDLLQKEERLRSIGPAEKLCIWGRKSSSSEEGPKGTPGHLNWGGRGDALGEKKGDSTIPDLAGISIQRRPKKGRGGRFTPDIGGNFRRERKKKSHATRENRVVNYRKKVKIVTFGGAPLVNDQGKEIVHRDGMQQGDESVWRAGEGRECVEQMCQGMANGHRWGKIRNRRRGKDIGRNDWEMPCWGIKRQMQKGTS